MSAPAASGDDGLLESLLSVLGRLDIEPNKLVGITTDGESGSMSFLWRLMSDHLGRGLLTFWCCAHRSDLAVEQIIRNVLELKVWKVNVISVATYFRTSKTDSKNCLTYMPVCKEVSSFAQHFCELINAVLFNRDACIQIWKSFAETGSKSEKAEATGFLRTWKGDTLQSWLTSVLGDIF